MNRDRPIGKSTHEPSNHHIAWLVDALPPSDRAGMNEELQASQFNQGPSEAFVFITSRGKSRRKIGMTEDMSACG